METWKEAFWLAKFELKKSRNGILMMLFILACSVFFFVTLIPEYLEKAFVLVDLFFILFIWFGGMTGKTKEFQIQKIDENVWASPFFIMLNQLPIKKDILIKSRFIVTFSLSIPFYLLFHILVYALTPALRVEMPLLAYCIFTFIWLCIGINFSSAFPAADAGERTSMWKSWIILILMFIAAIAFFTGFTLIFEKGFVAWTMIAARQWPLLSIIVSLLIAIGGVQYCKRYMLKKMKQIDYLK